MLDLNDTQTSILSLIFKYCDDNSLPAARSQGSGRDAQVPVVRRRQGRAGRLRRDVAGVGRRAAALDHRARAAGADIFFGEPEFDVADLLRTTADGQGIGQLLELSDVMDKPALFSTFMLWMLAQLYETLPEVGDLPKAQAVLLLRRGAPALRWRL